MTADATTADAAPFVPDTHDLGTLRAAASDCRGCHLYRDATQVVFSSGRSTAAAVLVGEQPGDVEDRRGKPFVGPAGQLLRRAMAEAGLDPSSCYLTNTVKHFKHHLDARGKRRIHDKPAPTEIRACRPWLEAELAIVRAPIVIALGATAAQAIAGPGFRITRQRGRLVDWPGPPVGPSPPKFLATLHPSAVLRADDRDAAYAGLVDDLRIGAALAVNR